MSATWFYDLGVRVFPTSGKRPAMKESWLDYRCTRDQAALFREYAVPLGLFGVVDTDTEAAEIWVAANLPPTPFTVTTGRGVHRYYRLSSDAPHYIHRAGQTIEFRHAGQYVIGPGSVRPDGVQYVARPWSWNHNDVPFFPVATFEWDDRPPEMRGSEAEAQIVLPLEVTAGERHDQMFKLMRSLQARGIEDIDVLLKVLHVENRLHCKPPIDRSELEKYIRRVARFRDKRDFVRIQMDDTALAAALLETGMSDEAALIAIRHINPKFNDVEAMPFDFTTLLLDAPPAFEDYEVVEAIDESIYPIVEAIE
jgi:hypothetical protein